MSVNFFGGVMSEVDRFLAEAKVVDRQASDGFHVEVDPDVAEVMGAFEEDAISLDDLDEVIDGV